MYTVIIANEKMTQLFCEYKRLFTPWLKDETVSLCSWNEEGPDLDTALPELSRVMHTDTAWRALIVHDPLCRTNENGDERFDESNPFDYREYYDGFRLEESRIPLIRLTHLLAGFPALGIRETVEKTSAVHTASDSIIYETKGYSDEELALHSRLEAQYDQLRHKPQEIWILSLRRRRRGPGRKELKEIWSSRLETESSLFWQRNNYPEKCRFLCFDISDKPDEFYAREIFEFWCTVLTLAVNRIPAGSLQAYKVYRTACRIDRTALQKILSKKYMQLVQVRDAVSQAILSEPEPVSVQNEEDILTVQAVPVAYDVRDENSLEMDTRRIGLSGNCPEDEAVIWAGNYKNARKYLTRFAREPVRAINRAAVYTRDAQERFFAAEYPQMDALQEEELSDALYQLEEDILSAQTMKTVDVDAYDDELNEANNEVLDVIEGRMKRGSTLAAGFSAIGLYFCGFIPYLIRAAADGRQTFLPSLALVLGALGVLALAAFLMLFVFRHRLVKAVERFNRLVKGIIQRINGAAGTYEEYLSLICTYMKGQAIADGTKKHRAKMISYRQLLRMHWSAVDDFDDQIAAWQAAFALTLTADPVPQQEACYDFEALPDESPVYTFEKNRSENSIQISASGEKITAPYPFIGALDLERIELYEREPAPEAAVQTDAVRETENGEEA